MLSSPDQAPSVPKTTSALCCWTAHDQLLLDVVSLPTWVTPRYLKSDQQTSSTATKTFADDGEEEEVTLLGVGSQTPRCKRRLRGRCLQAVFCPHMEQAACPSDGRGEVLEVSLPLGVNSGVVNIPCSSEIGNYFLRSDIPVSGNTELD